MSFMMLFVIMLIVGIALFAIGRRHDGKGKGILIICGILCCLFAVFGIVTAFL